MEELQSGFEDPFEAFHSDTDLRTTSASLYAAVEASLLFTIPREIRDKVYIELTRSGNLAIRRVSQVLYKETAPLVFKYGVRHLDFANKGENARFGHRITALIQNIDIKFNMQHKCLEYSHTLKPLRDFHGSTIPRQNCSIALIYRSNHLPINHRRLFQWAMDRFGGLTGFKHLTVCAEEGAYDYLNAGNPRAEAGISDYEMHLAMLSVAKMYLEPNIGPGTWQDYTMKGKKLLRLIFSPWKNL